jgi:hypothetical protein
MEEFEKTITFCESSHKLNPEMFGPAVLLAASYALIDRNDDAKRIEEWLNSVMTGGRPMWYYLRFFPFNNSNIVDRFVEGVVKSGLTKSTSSDFYKIMDENRLTGLQIRALLFGRKIVGLEGWFERSNDGRAIYRGFIAGYDQGQSWIEKDLLCDQWQERYGGHKICYPVFRNPEGSPENKDEYLYITDLKIFPFSVLN